jgi:hypothetical protein
MVPERVAKGETVMRPRLAAFGFIVLTGMLGCTQKALVHDELVRPSVIPQAHCRGEEWTNESSIAAVPIPVVAFLSPQVDLHEIKADDYLNRCGEPRQLVNRDVSVDRSACVPAAVTSRIFTLGIYQWCPSRVDYSADVAG